MTEHNPVYDRLTRRAGRPSAGEAIRLGLGIGAAALLAMAGPLAAGWTDQTPMRAMLALGAALTLFGPPLAMMAAALMTARDASQEDFRMLLVTGIAPRQIVNGYARGAVYRLRLLWAVGAGIAPGVWIALAAGVVQGLPGGPGACSPPYCLPVGGGWPLALLIGLLGAAFWLLIAYMLFAAGVAAGVWAGLRWPQDAVFRAGGLVVGYFMVPILGAAVLTLGWNLEPGTIGLCYGLVCFLLVGTPYANALLTNGLRAAAEQAIEARGAAMRGDERSQ
jgi:hypothetical protein